VLRAITVGLFAAGVCSRSDAQSIEYLNKSFVERIDLHCTPNFARQTGLMLSFIPRDLKVFAELERLRDKLESLEVARPPLTREHYRVIGNLHKLGHLEIRFNVVPAEALEDIGKLTELHTLKITLDCPGDKRLEALSGLQKLKRLELNTNGKFTEEGVLAIAKLKALWSFQFSVDELTPAMAEGIAGMTGIHALGINCGKASPEAFAKLSARLTLKELALLGAGVTDENLAGFSTPEGFHWINAPDTPLKRVFEPHHPDGWKLTQDEDRGYTLTWTEEKEGMLLKHEAKAEIPNDSGQLVSWSISPDRKTMLVARNLLQDSGKRRVRVGGLGLYDVATGKRLTAMDAGPILRAGFLSDGRSVVFQQGARVVEEDK
jgi:hypothetical protein